GPALLLPEIERAIVGVDEANLQALQQACAEAAERIVTHQPPQEIADAVREAHARLSSESVAVRSSATAEDMPQASFAGQYDSFLNVRGADAVIERMLHVWASLYSAHAVAYRRRQQIPDTGMRMAVIVQQQLAADAAGVLFTRNPVTGDDDHFFVNSTFGLGEGVVAGHMATDHFGVHPATGEVVSREVSTKPHMIALSRSGGVVEVNVDAAKQDQPSLQDGQLRELSALAATVRSLFGGGHQDIEFALHHGALHLLQARPVTAISVEPEFTIAWENPEDEKRLWVLQSIGQRKAIPMKRLEIDAMERYAAGSQVCFAETGSPMARMHQGIYQNGYRYVRPADDPDEEIAQRLERFQAGVRVYADQNRSWWDEALRPEVERALASIDAFRPRGAPLAALIEHLEQAMDVFGHVLGDLHWRLAARIVDGGQLTWSESFAEITGLPEHEAGVLVQAIENETTMMLRWLRKLARAVQLDATLMSIFAGRAYERLDEPPVRDQPAVHRFKTRFRNFLRRYGRRTGRGFGSATEFSTPTWSIDTRQPLDLIAAYAEQNLDTIDEMEASARRERERTVRQLRRKLSADDEQLARFDQIVFMSRDIVRTMENHNYMMEQSTGGALREAIHWAGQRLVRDRLLDDPDDVLHLSLDELKSIAAGARPDARALVRERRRELEEQSRLVPPRLIGSGSPASLPPMPKWMEMPENAGRDGGLIRGTAASRGRVTGTARVVPQTAAPPKVEKGDILVAENAGPNWTPVFPLIGGLVLDQGAVFQHAALVAREYRIPAVVLTKDGTTEIKDGQTITVDGDEGIVELH
ncbi:MAG: PEP/pyruvate-binding domain-containing protein, partial [Dehalococcoidia bacterium]